eukprot:PITA_06021
MLEDKTPQEVWTGKKHSPSHLRVFGCDAYVHVPKEKRTKLDSKYERCTFIRYKDGLKAYKLWNPKIKKESEDEEPQTPDVRRLVREKRKPGRYSPSTFCSNFALSIIDDDPRTVREAVDSEDEKLWKEAMVDEMTSIHKNEAWDLVELLARRKPFGNKLVLKKKMNAKGKVEK